MTESDNQEIYPRFVLVEVDSSESNERLNKVIKTNGLAFRGLYEDNPKLNHGDSSKKQHSDEGLQSKKQHSNVEPPKPEPDAWKWLQYHESKPNNGKETVTAEHPQYLIQTNERAWGSANPLYSSETIKEQIEHIGEELDERIKLALEEKEKAEEDSWEEKRSIVRINSYEMAVRKLKKLEQVFSEE